MAAKKLNFEQSLSRLEEIVRTLETGNLPLADSMKLFEEGTGLLTSCTGMLDEAEQKVVLLKVNRDGKLTEEPFADPEA